MSLIVVPRERRWFISGCPGTGRTGGSIEARSMVTLCRRRCRFHAITDAVVVFPFGKRILAVVDITSVMGLENEAGARPYGLPVAGLGGGGGLLLLLRPLMASGPGRRVRAIHRRPPVACPAPAYGWHAPCGCRRAAGRRPAGPERHAPCRSQWLWGLPALYVSAQKSGESTQRAYIRRKFCYTPKASPRSE